MNRDRSGRRKKNKIVYKQNICDLRIQTDALVQENDIDGLRKLCNENPLFFYAKMELAKLLRYSDLNEAIYLLRYVSMLSPRPIGAKRELAEIKISLNQFDEARKIVGCDMFVSSQMSCDDVTSDESGTNMYLVLMRGKIELNDGNYLGARRCFEALIGTELTNAAYLNLGSIEAKIGSLAKAREYYNMALEYNSNDLGVRLHLAQAYYKAGMFVDAEWHLDELEYLLTNQDIRKSTFVDMDVIMIERAKLAFENKQYDAAFCLLNKLSVKRRDSMLLMAKIKAACNKVNEAKSDIEKILHDEPYYDHARRTMAQIEYLSGNYDKAEEILRGLFNSKCKNKAYNDLIHLYIVTGRYSEARDMINAAKDKNIILADDYVAFLRYRTEFNPCNKVKLPPIDNLSFTARMFASYDEMDVLKQIKKIHTNEIRDNAKAKYAGTLFIPEVDVDLLFEKAKKEYLLPENKISTLNCCDEYCVFVDGIGTRGENALKILTIHGTKEIVNMYPTFYNVSFDLFVESDVNHNDEGKKFYKYI